MVGSFKSAATRRINRMRHTPGATLWQRNYYEHIIRNEHELHAVRRYIENNPVQWDLDRDNPQRIPK
jgi:REP element-mobilizing transposase RayT